MKMAQGTARHKALEVAAPRSTGGRVLSDSALDFVAALADEFMSRRDELLAQRLVRQARFDAGALPDFAPETREIREGSWRVAPPPRDLEERKVEITGPVDRKMIINALNSGADVFMADFEDSTAPTWTNLLQGQENLIDAVRRTIDFVDPASGKQYRLKERTATLMARPRGWHLPEAHLHWRGQPLAASLVDFGLYAFHNAKALLERGSGPYFYLPKLESHLEARLWNDVFARAEELLGLPRAAIRATVLIETLPAAFAMHEILYELRERSVGLNCGRWDYIFSFIKTRRADPQAILPDRAQVTMTQPCMRAYTQLVVQTCHRRGAHAMGGMAAQIPIKNDAPKNEEALAKVRADKLREVQDGHDGTWVAHPALVPVARQVFEQHLTTKNQIDRQRDDVRVTAADLLRVPEGPRTEAGLRQNIDVGVQYLAAWLSGQGCVPLHHLMEDAATAEISRTQVWQWLKHGARLDGGPALTPERFVRIVDEEVQRMAPSPTLQAARSLFERLSTAPDCEAFLTLPAYELLCPPDEKE